MKALVITRHGGPDVVAVQEAQVPEAGPGEVRVAIRAAALNHLDLNVRNGGGRFKLPMPHILGSDGCGVVESVGPGVASFGKGDAVIINPALSCGECEFCLSGDHSVCASFSILGAGRPGTFAEYVVAPARNLRPKPGYLSFEEGAALPLAHLTAWRMLVARAGLRAGESVLIHGIGGGVALAALQIARLCGAKVLVTSSSDEKLKRATDLGADHAIHYVRDNVVARVKDLTGGRGVDVAFDSVGAATWGIDFAAVRRGGRIVLCGVNTGAVAETNLQALYWNQLTVLGSTMGSAEDLRQMLEAVEQGGLRPVISRVYGLDEGAEALAEMEAGRQFGKIVLKVGS